MDDVNNTISLCLICIKKLMLIKNVIEHKTLWKSIQTLFMKILYKQHCTIIRDINMNYIL